MGEYCRARQVTDDNKMRDMRFSCCKYKDTETHSEYEIPTAFRRQKCLQERSSILHLYVHCLSFVLHLVVHEVTEAVRKLRNLTTLFVFR